MDHFAYQTSGALSAEDVPLSRIASEVGTPTFVYSRATLERHYFVFDRAFAGHPHLVCYSVKANSNLALLSLLSRLGSGADIVSAGELLRAQRAQIPADRTVFSGVGKTEAEMTAAIEAGILAFNVESEGELMLLAKVAAGLGRRAPVALRVNPNVDAKTHPYIATGLSESKFGIPLGEAALLAERIKSLPSLELLGLDCHIGSQLVSIEPLVAALSSVLTLADELLSRGFRLQLLDLGGGLGINYRGESPPHPDDLGRAVLSRMSGRKERLILEPGRVLVGNVGVLLTRVLYKKTSGPKTFVIVDAAMNDLLRPALYQAHHDIWPIEPRKGDPQVVDVVGPVCESADCFATARPMQPIEPGDLLAIKSAGAYGFSMASNYNSRPLAAEALVDGDRYSVVRKRQRLEEMFAQEVIPDFSGSQGAMP